MQPRPTYVACLTPLGRGAIACVALDGPQATALIKQHFRGASTRSVERASVGRVLCGRWYCAGFANAHDTSPAEELIVVRLANDRWEIHCHGGVAAVAAIVDALEHRGAIRAAAIDVAEPGESPLQHEARLALAQAATEHTARILLDQYHGALGQATRHIAAAVARGDWVAAQSQLNCLLERAGLGLHLTRPWQAVLTGPPNVGKSTLINTLVGFERTLVFDQPGTTRDVVQVAAAVGGWPVTFSDTAGWRSTHHPLEAEGQQLAARHLATADLVLLVVDDSTDVADWQSLRQRWPAALVVVNKIDRRPAPWPAEALDGQHAAVGVSAKQGTGIETLLRAIEARLVVDPPPPGAPVPFLPRHVSLLERASQAIAARPAPDDTCQSLALAALQQMDSLTSDERFTING